MPTVTPASPVFVLAPLPEPRTFAADPNADGQLDLPPFMRGQGKHGAYIRALQYCRALEQANAQAVFDIGLRQYANERYMEEESD